MEPESEKRDRLIKEMQSTPLTFIPNDPEPSRAMIAAMCLQGLLANSPDWNPIESNLEWASRAAVLFADALIAELQKPKP
jgi:hypothetical protein